MVKYYNMAKEIKFLGITLYKPQPDVELVVDEPHAQTDIQSPKAYFDGWGNSNYQPIYPIRFDGEKTIGEIGPIYQYFMDYPRLRLRSKQLFIESEPCQAVVKKYVAWTIGGGLTLKAEPQVEVLKTEGITITPEAFNKSVESRWKIYSNSKMGDATGKQTLNELEAQALLERIIGGDMLVVLSVVGGTVKVRHIDGGHLVTPPYFSPIGMDATAPNGNRVRGGVEIDASGQHVAYYVRTDDILTYDRIEAFGKKSGMRMAYLLVGPKYTIDSERGMPLLAAVMETAKKLERYNAAAVAGAEERQKVSFFFEHDTLSSNEDPQAGIRAKASAGRGNIQADLAPDVNGNRLAANIAVSEERNVYNLPNGTTIKSIDSKQEVNVNEFGMFQIDLICAAVGIPPNVAMSKYEDSFSASRMAGKDWEHTFMLDRKTFSQQYLDPIYSLQVYLWVLNNKVEAPGYVKALMEKNEFATAAYLSCRWVGDSFPDIDPLKTAKYLRTMMGPALAHLPIMDAEAAAEAGMQGEWDGIVRQSSEELKMAARVGITPPVEQVRINDAI